MVEAKTKSSSKEIEEGKVVAFLAYFIWIVGFIWYFADDKMRKNNFAKFHVKQSLVLIILSVAVGILGMIPFLGWFIILPLGYLLVFVLWIIGIVNSLSGKEKELWLVGGFAKYLTF